MDCVICEGHPSMIPGKAPTHVIVGGITYKAELPAEICPKCHRPYFSMADEARFEQSVALRVALDCVPHPEGVRVMRKALGLSTVELSKLMDTVQESISRWETGKRPLDKKVYAVLCLLTADSLLGSKQVVGMLKKLVAGVSPEKEVVVDLIPESKKFEF